jgi:hypothetical protein
MLYFVKILLASPGKRRKKEHMEQEQLGLSPGTWDGL